jgi:hypothetical protein
MYIYTYINTYTDDNERRKATKGTVASNTLSPGGVKGTMGHSLWPEAGDLVRSLGLKILLFTPNSGWNKIILGFFFLSIIIIEIKYDQFNIIINHIT